MKVAVSAATTLHDLKLLVLSFHPVIAFDTVEEERVEAIADQLGKELNLPVFVWTLGRGLVRKPTAHPTLTTETAEGVMAHLRAIQVDAIFLLKDFARHLTDPAVCREFRNAANAMSRTAASMWISGAGHSFPPDAEASVIHHSLALPSKKELGDVVMAVVRSLRDRAQAKVEISRDDLDRLLGALSGLTIAQARQAVARSILEDGKLSVDDIARVLDEKATLIARGGLLEYFPAEDNAWQLGGFENLKRWLDRAKVGFSEAAKELNLHAPRGILMVGVQGCGKSLAAKFTARAWGMPLLKLDAGRLYDKYHGESEKNLRRAIALAEAMAPCVLWIDELEKSFASFGSSELDSGTSQRIFATLLTWMQEKKQPVFLVATANDVFRLPPELMRKGRFDELFFVDLPDAGERETIFRIHLTRRKQDASAFDLAQLVATSEGMSGAEIEQAVVSSLYGALHEQRTLDTSALARELAATVPLSVTRAEDIAKLRELAEGRFVPVK